MSVAITNDTASPEKCRDFVQHFYDWYVNGWDVPDSRKTESMGGDQDRALEYRAINFSSDLSRMLKEDRAAQLAAHEIVGLDFDPIVHGQDINGKFTVPSASLQNGHCFANVYETPDGAKQSTTPLVIPELVKINDDWVFVNFHYPAQSNISASDLISTLRSAKEDREKNSSR